jgi:ABC-type lipoprotein release transport system permease subunit
MLTDADATDRTVATLDAALPPAVRALSWRRTAPELDAAVTVDNFGNYFFNAVLIAIVSLAVLEALLVSVLHRGREFGVLQALGLTAGATSAVVLAEGMCLALVSGALGLLVGGGITAWLGHTGIDLTAMLSQSLSIAGAVVNPVVHPVVRPDRAWQGVAIVAALGLLSSLYPMWRASRVDVATAMHADQ